MLDVKGAFIEPGTQDLFVDELKLDRLSSSFIEATLKLRRTQNGCPDRETETCGLTRQPTRCGSSAPRLMPKPLGRLGDWSPSLMNPTLAFTLLAHRPQAIPRVAQWWCDEWGLPSRHSSCAEYVHELQALVPGTLPLHLLADQADCVVGVATLKVKINHPMIPGQSHWLSGVYVDPAWRSRGVASALCSEILEAARSRGVEHVYLQTERLDGGLYAGLGWTPLRRHHEADGVEQVVMVKDLSPAARAGGDGAA